MRTSEKPKPIITGDSQAQGIAKFAGRTTYEDFAPERRERLKVSVLDSLACAINALGAPPIVACLEQAYQFGGSDARCTLIGGGKANVVYAAQYNTALVRYIDFMDSYLGGEELCHPSDNVGAVLAACEYAGRSGQEFLAALAVAYQVESELTANAPFMADGFDLTTQLSFSIAAGASRALQLDEALQNQIRVQLSAIGHPLLGDRKYNPLEKLERRITRVALHAARLQFIHPRSGESVCVDCEPPPDFRSLLQALGFPIHTGR